MPASEPGRGRLLQRSSDEAAILAQVGVEIQGPPGPPGHECPGYVSTEKPGEPGSKSEVYGSRLQPAFRFQRSPGIDPQPPPYRPPGSLTRPRNRIIPLALSRMRNRNGRST